MHLQLRDQSAANATVRSPSPDSVDAKFPREPSERPGKRNLLRDVDRSAISIAALISVVLAVCGIAGLGSRSMFPALLLVLSSLVATTALFVAMGLERPSGSRGANRNRLPRSELERKIETLEDLRWQARDDADRLKTLLDAQASIILKRDTRGRITFANQTFCYAFGVELENVLNKPFHPTVLDSVEGSSSPNLLGEKLPLWMRPSVQLLDMSNGARWIEWTHQRLINITNNDTGIQTIGRDVTDQRRHEEELSRARDEARTADRAKSRFLASMSHEIRTPMNGILGMAGLLGETEQSPEQRTYIQAVRKSALTLRALIDEILDFSKIEAGYIELANDPVDIVDCVQGAIELLAPRAYQKQLQLVWSTAPDMPRQFIGDEARLRQIVLNLLGNAVKFTEQGGISVWVGTENLSEQMDEVKIVIRDTGPGLSEEAIACIFMEFERAVPEGSIQESGTGLGLAIAQRLAQSMGGGIKVTSVPGMGATFALSVRLLRASLNETQQPLQSLNGRHVAIISPEHIERRTTANFLRAHNMAVTEFVDLGELIDWQCNGANLPPDTMLLDCNVDPRAAQSALDELSRDAKVQAAVIGSTGDRAEFERFSRAGVESFLVRPVRPATLLALLAGVVDKPAIAPLTPDKIETEDDGAVCRRVLVAEDNEINALLTRTVLSKLGCEPVVVVNGREAIEEVERSLTGRTPRLDAILMDLHMPEVDGLQATAKIHQLYKAAGLPRPAIVAITANAFQEDREKCIAAGMDDYLSKPFEPGDLRRVLDEVSRRLPRQSV